MEVKMFTIEKDIPISEAKTYLKPFKKMEIGDSVFISLSFWVENLTWEIFWTLIHKDAPNKEFTIRTVLEPVMGFRVWRIPLLENKKESRLFWEQNEKRLKMENKEK